MSTESASSPVEWASRPARHSATNIAALMTRTRIRTRRCRASTTWTSQHSSMGSPTSMRHGVTGRMASARSRSGLRQVLRGLPSDLRRGLLDVAVEVAAGDHEARGGHVVIEGAVRLRLDRVQGLRRAAGEVEELVALLNV